MCGIVGVVFRDPQQRVDEHRLAAARDTLAHRGPDERGLWARPGVALAHRRLSILDLAHGQQPFVSTDNQRALTYNGEVYNYRALMRGFAERGATFNTTCDTELVFHALSADGPAALDRFHGMFALGYYDHAERRLLLARDRMGQKPLYWTTTCDALVFASELKAILAYTQGEYDLDPAAVEEFFTRGYVLSPRTIFTGIHKLPAGCRLTLDADTWRYNVEAWWDAEPMDLGELTDERVVDTLDELLNQSVRDRLIADVPIGTLLSGGIDSSLITAMASNAQSASSGGGGVKTFTIGFSESEALDETPYAKMVAERYNCDWRCETIDQDAGDWLAELDEAAGYYDEPFGNFTVTSQRTLSRLCREDLTVVLSGQGGDELSAGYPGRYNWVHQTEALATKHDQRSRYAPPVDDVVHHLQRTAFLAWKGVRASVFSAQAHAQMHAAASPIDTISPFWQRFSRHDRLGNVLYTDAKTNLADYLVCIEERASMSCSLEARNPMLDHRVVQYMLSLPARYKVRPGSGPMSSGGLQNKWVLHELAKRYLPTEVFDRPKRGFTPPIQRWVQRYADRIADVFREMDGVTAPLYSDGWRGYLTAGRYEPGATMPVYYALVFALWVKKYADHIRSIPGSAGQASSAGGQAFLPVTGQRPEPTTIDISIPAPPNDRQECLPPCSDRSRLTNALLHRVYREQSPETIATARWFCQALRNFEPGSTIRLVGDDDGGYRWLAGQCGLSVVDDDDCDGTALVGMDAMRRFNVNELAGSTLLLFTPFTQAEQGELNGLLRRVNENKPVQGHQAVPIGNGQGVLIARCACAAVST